MTSPSFIPCFRSQSLSIFARGHPREQNHISARPSLRGLLRAAGYFRAAVFSRGNFRAAFLAGISSRGVLWFFLVFRAASLHLHVNCFARISARLVISARRSSRAVISTRSSRRSSRAVIFDTVFSAVFSGNFRLPKPSALSPTQDCYQWPILRHILVLLPPLRPLPSPAISATSATSLTLIS